MASHKKNTIPVDAGGYIGCLRPKINSSVIRGSAARRAPRCGQKRLCRYRNVAQDCPNARANLRDILVDTRLVASHRVTVDDKKLLLRKGAAEHIDQHAAELAGGEIGLLSCYLRKRRKLGGGERAQQCRRDGRIDLLMLLNGRDCAIE